MFACFKSILMLLYDCFKLDNARLYALFIWQQKFCSKTVFSFNFLRTNRLSSKDAALVDDLLDVDLVPGNDDHPEVRADGGYLGLKGKRYQAKD